MPFGHEKRVVGSVYAIIRDVTGGPVHLVEELALDGLLDLWGASSEKNACCQEINSAPENPLSIKSNCLKFVKDG